VSLALVALMLARKGHPLVPGRLATSRTHQSPSSSTLSIVSPLVDHAFPG